MQCVRAQFKDSAEMTWRRGGPEGEFLHERAFFAAYQFFEFAVEGREVWVLLNGVERGMVALVSLIFPYMDCPVVDQIFCIHLKRKVRNTY